jgi:hypothetical protein
MTLASHDWQSAAASLDAQGWALLQGLLDAKNCAKLRALYDKALFRSTVVMARHGFGKGEYKYFAYPLPEPVAALRASLYVRLAPIAGHWAAMRGEEIHYPATHADYLKRCHQAGQSRPTPLLLKYGPATIIACTRICTASMSFRCRWRSFCRNQARISRAANS